MKNPLSLEAMRDWLRTMPADEFYDLDNSQTCLLGQFHLRLGAAEVRYFGWTDQNGTDRVYDTELLSVAINHPWTYGAALGRVEQAISNREKS